MAQFRYRQHHYSYAYICLESPFSAALRSDFKKIQIGGTKDGLQLGQGRTEMETMERKRGITAPDMGDGRKLNTGIETQ